MNKKVLRFLAVMFILILSFSSVYAATLPEFPGKNRLREFREVIYDFDFLTKTVVFALAIVLCVVASLAYTKSKSKKLLFVLIAFVLFALKWLIKILDVFFLTGGYFTDPLETIFELGIFMFLFLALFKK